MIGKRQIFNAAVLTIVMAFTGCATTGFLGLATTKYVDSQVSDSQTEIDKLDKQIDLAYEDYDENRQRLNELESEIRDLMSAKEELERLVEVIRQNEAATAELQDLAVQVEQKLNTIPDETLMLLATMIQDYLQE